MTSAFVNRIGTAVPDHDVHKTFIDFADQMLPDDRSRRVFRRMAQRAEIEHRYSYLEPGETLAIAADRSGFYGRGHFPGTGARMERFEAHARDLAKRAVTALGIGDEIGSITHLVLASCTGFTAPGVDQQLVDDLGLDDVVRFVPFTQDTANLYQASDVVVAPSQGPELGRPVIEAAASGVPVVASSHASLDEACGDAALRADPESAEGFAAQLARSLDGGAELVSRGLAHSRRFTWKACGRALLEGYETAL